MRSQTNHLPHPDTANAKPFRYTALSLLFGALLLSLTGGCNEKSTPPLTPAHIVTGTDTLRFTSDSNGVIPDEQILTITNSGDEAMSWSLAVDAGWLTSTPSSGSRFADTITVRPATTELALGDHHALITISSPEADNSPQTVSIVYTIAEQLAHIAHDSGSLSFRAFVNGAIPSAQEFTLSNSGGRVLDWTVSEDAEWLTLSPTSGNANATTISATVTTTDLALGEHTATITIAATNAGNSPQTVPVTYTIEPMPHIDLDSTALTFAGTEEGALPNAGSFRITNSGGGTLAWNVTDNSDWLRLSPETGNGNSNLVSALITSTSLTAGNYSGTITVTADNADNSPQTIMVIYNLTERLAHISFDSASYEYAAFQNGPKPKNRTFTLSNTGGRTMTWSGEVTQAEEEPWIAIEPEIGVGNVQTITLRILRTSLPAGTHLSSIKFSSPDADNNPQEIIISYTLTPRPPK